MADPEGAQWVCMNPSPIPVFKYPMKMKYIGQTKLFHFHSIFMKNEIKSAKRTPHTFMLIKVRKRAKIKNRYNQAPHLTQDTNGKVTTSQLDITNKSQEVSPFPTGDHNASINRRARKHNKNKTKITQMITKEAPPWNGQ